MRVENGSTNILQQGNREDLYLLYMKTLLVKVSGLGMALELLLQDLTTLPLL
jgi:hypothetical protein